MSKNSKHLYLWNHDFVPVKLNLMTLQVEMDIMTYAMYAQADLGLLWSSIEYLQSIHYVSQQCRL